MLDLNPLDFSIWSALQEKVQARPLANLPPCMRLSPEYEQHLVFHF
jgi:hypothetical protein